jgi:hypothetical protein
MEESQTTSSSHWLHENRPLKVARQPCSGVPLGFARDMAWDHEYSKARLPELMRDLFALSTFQA